jgi:hypothetical protein
LPWSLAVTVSHNRTSRCAAFRARQRSPMRFSREEHY